jgi:hypothetical protein
MTTRSSASTRTAHAGRRAALVTGRRTTPTDTRRAEWRRERRPTCDIRRGEFSRDQQRAAARDARRRRHPRGTRSRSRPECSRRVLLGLNDCERTFVLSVSISGTTDEQRVEQMHRQALEHARHHSTVVFVSRAATLRAFTLMKRLVFHLVALNCSRLMNQTASSLGASLVESTDWNWRERSTSD